MIPVFLGWNAVGLTDSYLPLIVPYWFGGGAMNIFLLRQFFRMIPKETDESARIDGASWLAVFTKIYIPLTKPIMVSAGLLIFFYQWQSFVWPLIAANAPEVRVVQVALSVFQQENGTLWGEIFAASVVTTVLPLMFFFPLQKYYKMGISTSGMKE